MKKCTFIKVRQNGHFINSYIYKTDSHALAFHQLSKDYPEYSRPEIVCEAMTIDADDEKYKEVYQAHKDCGCVEDVFGWD